MRQAIQTEYAEDDEHIFANCPAGYLYVGWSDKLSVEENHIKAAADLCRKLGWEYQRVSGMLDDGSFVHVETSKPWTPTMGKETV